MLSDPLPLIYDAVTYQLRRINQDAYSSEYLFRDATHQLTLRIRHTTTNGKAGENKKDRHNIELVRTVFAAGEVPEVTKKVYLVVEQEPGDVGTKLVNSLANKLIGNSDALITSLLGWES